MNDDVNFLFVLRNKDQQMLSWNGKPIHKSIKDQAEHFIY